MEVYCCLPAPVFDFLICKVDYPTLRNRKRILRCGLGKGVQNELLNVPHLSSHTLMEWGHVHPDFQSWERISMSVGWPVPLTMGLHSGLMGQASPVAGAHRPPRIPSSVALGVWIFAWLLGSVDQPRALKSEAVQVFAAGQWEADASGLETRHRHGALA